MKRFVKAIDLYIAQSNTERKANCTSKERSTYNYLARLMFNRIIESLEQFALGDCSFLQKQQKQEFLRVATIFVNNHLGKGGIVISTEKEEEK